MGRYHTQWAGQFYVAAELTRRGYSVTLTLGNARRTDLVVISPNGTMFKVEVKALSNKNFWIISPPPDADDHFYVLVYLPKDEAAPPQFFVMTCRETQQLRKAYEAKTKARGSKYSDDFAGFNWRDPFAYAGRWESLPK